MAGDLLQEEAAAGGIFDMGGLKLEFFVGVLEQGCGLAIAGSLQHPVEDQVDAKRPESAGQRPGVIFPEGTEDRLGVGAGGFRIAGVQSDFGQRCLGLVGQVLLADPLVEGYGPTVKGDSQGRRITLQPVGSRHAGGQPAFQAGQADAAGQGQPFLADLYGGGGIFAEKGNQGQIGQKTRPVDEADALFQGVVAVVPGQIKLAQ